MPPHRLQHIVRADRVLPEILIGGIACDKLYVRIGGQVKDHIDAAHCAERKIEVLKIAFEKLEMRMAL